jgi:hypothetical protein
MPLSKEDLLLEDYKTSLDLYKYGGQRKANLFTMFFLIQGGLFTFFGWLIPNHKAVAILLCVLAALFSLLWSFAMERMRAFIKLRACQLEQIEKKLGVMTSLTNEEMLRSKGKTEISGHTYKLSFYQRLFSVSSIESILPVIVGIFWLLIATAVMLNLF